MCNSFAENIIFLRSLVIMPLLSICIPPLYTWKTCISQTATQFLHPQKALSHLPPRLYFGDTEVKGLSWPLTLKAVKGGFRVRQVLKTATGWSCFHQWKTSREITKWYMSLQKYLKWILILSNQNTVIKSRTNKNNFQILLTFLVWEGFERGNVCTKFC